MTKSKFKKTGFLQTSNSFACHAEFNAIAFFRCWNKFSMTKHHHLSCWIYFSNYVMV